MKKILIAEDYADIRMMMRILLEVYGFEVLEADDGFEALTAALEHRPDLILLDLAMPTMDGIQSVKEMRRHIELSETPIVAVTAFGEFYREWAIEAGCTDIVSKPLDYEGLKPLVDRYLNYGAA